MYNDLRDRMGYEIQQKDEECNQREQDAERHCSDKVNTKNEEVQQYGKCLKTLFLGFFRIHVEICGKTSFFGWFQRFLYKWDLAEAQNSIQDERHTADYYKQNYGRFSIKINEKSFIF